MTELANQLESGIPRAVILERLDRGQLTGISADMIQDLRASVEKERERKSSQLMDTRIPCVLNPNGVVYLVQDGVSLKNQSDPARLAIIGGRGSIGSLLSSLYDSSPARAACIAIHPKWTTRSVMRTQDIALALIERLGKVYFDRTDYLSRLPETDRRLLVQSVRAWWTECSNKAAACDLEYQLIHGSARGQFQAAAMLWKNAEKPEGKARAHAALQRLVQEPSLRDGGEDAAVVLLEHGDTLPLDVFTRRAQEAWQSGRPFDWYLLFPVKNYGGRREWEWIYRLVTREYARGEYNTLFTLELHADGIRQPQWAIPVFGLVFEDKKTSGRNLGEGAEGNWAGALLFLEKQTGQDFGYNESSADHEAKAAALTKAKQWWAFEGSKKYTFGEIAERSLTKK